MEICSKRENYPVLLNFQNGSFQRNETEDCKGGVYINKLTESSQRTVVVAIDDVVYSGNENVNNYCRNMIIARNRSTGKMRLIEVGNAFLKAVTEIEQSVIHDTVDAAEINVNETFGSKRRKRLIEQTKRLTIHSDAMKDQLEKTVAEKQIDSIEMNKDLVDVKNTLNKYTPPMNRDASNVNDVFNVNDFLTDEQIDILKVTVHTILESDSHEIELKDYIANHFTKLSLSMSPKKDLFGALLLYTDCVMKYLTEDYKIVSKSNYIVCPYSELINNFVLEMFSMTSERGRTRPQSLKDKAICYIIALLLFVNNYVIPDIKTLSEVLKDSVVHLTKMTRVLGAHIAGDTIILKLPLSQPLLANRKRDRR